MFSLIGVSTCTCKSRLSQSNHAHTVLMRANQPETAVRRLLGLLCTHTFFICNMYPTGSMSERADMREEVLYGDRQDYYDVILSTYVDVVSPTSHVQLLQLEMNWMMSTPFALSNDIFKTGNQDTSLICIKKLLYLVANIYLVFQVHYLYWTCRRSQVLPQTSAKDARSGRGSHA